MNHTFSYSLRLSLCSQRNVVKMEERSLNLDYINCCRFHVDLLEHFELPYKKCEYPEKNYSVRKPKFVIQKEHKKGEILSNLHCLSHSSTSERLISYLEFPSQGESPAKWQQVNHVCRCRAQLNSWKTVPQNPEQN